MRTLKNYENKSRGTPDFPCTLYHVDRSHSDYCMPFHWHAEYEIITVLKGSMELSADEHVMTLNTGDVAFLSDGVLHGGTPSGDGCIYNCVVFSGDLLTKNTSRSEIRDIFRHGRTVQTFMPRSEYASVSEIAKRLCDAISGHSCDADEMISLGIFLEFFGEVIKNGACTDGYTETNRHIKRLKNVLSYIDEHYPEKITLDELAGVAGVTPKYLCRSFYSLTGKTPVSYLNEYRIECACGLLRNSDESLLDIAVACGFNDQSYFVKQFRRFTGTTPGSYRRGTGNAEY